MALKIGFVSTYLPTQCGIATYTQRLAEALVATTGETVHVISEEGAADGLVGSVHSHPSFSRRSDYVPSVVQTATRLGLEVAHIQYATDIFGVDDRLPNLLAALESAGIRSVVTMHTVFDFWSGLLERQPGAIGFHRKLGEQCSSLVVHHDKTMKGRLVAQGISAPKVTIIPHGTLSVDRPDQRASRERLGLPVDGPLGLCLGFIHAQKNVHLLFKAWPGVVKAVPDAHLVVAGSVQNPVWYNRLYLAYLRRLQGRGTNARHTELRAQFVAEEDIPAYLSAADLLLFPYFQGYGSASGALHLAIGAGKMVLCSDIPKFEEVGLVSGELMLPALSARKWSKGIARCLVDEPFRKKVSKKLDALSRETLWDAVALRHLDLYSELSA